MNHQTGFRGSSNEGELRDVFQLTQKELLVFENTGELVLPMLNDFARDFIHWLQEYQYYFHPTPSEKAIEQLQQAYLFYWKQVLTKNIEQELALSRIKLCTAFQLVGMPIYLCLSAMHDSQDWFLSKLNVLLSSQKEKEELKKIFRKVMMKEMAMIMEDYHGLHYGLKLWENDELSFNNSNHSTQQIDEKLLGASHKIKMAEMATTILHDVGNVMNSVSVEAELIKHRLEQSKWLNFLEAIHRLVHIVKQTQGSSLYSQDAELLCEYLDKINHHFKDLYHQNLEGLNSIYKNIQHMKAIIKMQQKCAKTDRQVEQVDLAQLITEVVQLFQPSLTKANINLQCFLEPIPSIEINNHLMIEVLTNLISNAKDSLANKENATITIDLKMVGQHQVSIGVEDNGGGIDEKHLNQIFEYGFTTKKEGHGFGLHSVQRSMRLLGGDITVKSKGLGEGSLFILTLPIETQKT